MTRLTENDIQHIRRRMALHDEELTSQTGYGLAGLAMLAAGGDSRFLKRLHTARVGIIPLTTGQGIIGGFSDSVEAILSYIGMDCFVTDQPDAAGIAEAVERGAGQIFIADDLICTMIDLHAHCSVENSACTGRAFAAALAARAGDLHHRSVTVLGAGVVGREGAEFCAAAALISSFMIAIQRAQRRFAVVLILSGGKSGRGAGRQQSLPRSDNSARSYRAGSG